MSSTTLPSQILGSVASAAGTGLDAASHLVADATESIGDIAGAAIDVGGNAAGVIADSTVRSARKAWSAAPDAVAAIRRHPVLAATGAAVLVTCFMLARRRRHSDSDAFGDVERSGPRGVKAVDAA
ncbi:MAG TPA: hypothetical protein VNO51_14240 [Ilumatobacteraceae bacterium]|nr:hypothetical protein [Ilumatobacteraceae bacterium]